MYMYVYDYMYMYIFKYIHRSYATYEHVHVIKEAIDYLHNFRKIVNVATALII